MKDFILVYFYLEVIKIIFENILYYFNRKE